MRTYPIRSVFAGLAILLSLSAAFAALHGISTSISADPSLAMYDDFNKAFVRHWKARSGVDVVVKPARSKSGEPIRAKVDGLDVVTLALSYDADALKKNRTFMLPDRQKPLPQKSPYTSTIVFLVRAGNPKNLRDWGDLTRPDVQVITSNPKTTQTGRWSYLAAWGYAFKQSGGNEALAFEFVRNLFTNAERADSEPGGAITAFIDRGVGDILLAWENEAHLLARARGSDRLEVVTPTMSILAEPIVNVVNEVSDQNGARDVANAYIDFLYTAQAQDIAGKHYYRPRDEKAAAKFARQFPPMDLFSIDEVFGGWKEAQNTHFDYGGLLDQIQRKQRLSASKP
ncbi:sulfate ABC transporter substrate-binding protein [Nitrosovibrio tenuis]|uniref:Sulfate transport system substrate-binding protein n=1 Tax=Nitrosovibrio tenuis TaxID=1233 RepID=A0A1H7I4Y9_9PROT|nr:sulfate ABC transporter substrate-binding protein [Nitrosovibrio tenuis]SEK57621.1 sulfate transport system substrate-binding protein [Nitrosovibrio tenuis]